MIRLTALFAGLLALTLYMPAHAVKDGQVFNDWKTQCPEKGASSKTCHIFQNLVAKDGKSRVLHIAIGYVEGRDDPAAIITLPLGLSLPQGVGLRVDENTPSRHPYQACFNSGCQAGFPVDSTLMAQLRGGDKAYIRVYDLSNQQIDIPISLSGFTAAIKAVQN